MIGLNAKALMMAAHDFIDAAQTDEPRLETAIRTYLRESGIGAVVEAARECRHAFAVKSKTAAAIMDDILRAAAQVSATVAALDKEPGHD